MRGFRRWYGANALHLIAHLAAFLFAGWAITQIVGGGAAVNWIAWFIGAALLHDLLLVPLYSAGDRALVRAASSPATPGKSPARRPGVVNYVRFPAAIGGILLLVYFPLILGLSSAQYRQDTGHALSGYTGHWLLICAGLFGISALLYVVHVALTGSRGSASAEEHPAPGPAEEPPGPGPAEEPPGPGPAEEPPGPGPAEEPPAPAPGDEPSGPPTGQ
jgi:hypothetical protein